MQVRALTPDDVDRYVALRREALTAAPHAFGASLEDDRGLSADHMRASLANTTTSAVFGAFDGDSLVGIVGLHREPMIKARHLATIWGMYVATSARGRGTGASLLRAAIDRARAWPGVVQLQLAVSESAPEARRLYERVGFRAWGLEPRALQWNDRYYGEHHMTLALDA